MFNNYRDLAARLGCVSSESNDWQGDCPDCGKRKHFYMNVKSGVGKCFHCGEGFSPFALSRLANRMGLVEKLGVSFHAQPATPLEIRESIPEITKLRGNALDAWLSAVAITRVSERYIIGAITRLSEKQNMDLMRYRGIKVSMNGRYRERLLIPVYVDGIANVPSTFIARSLFRNNPRYMMPASRDSRRKSSCLFAPCMATLPASSILSVPFDAKIILVEGAMDALHLGGNAVSILGKSLSTDQVRMLEVINPSEITVLLDSDTTSHDYSVITSKLKNAIDCKVYAAVMSGGDPASNPYEADRALDNKKFVGDVFGLELDSMFKEPHGNGR